MDSPAYSAVFGGSVKGKDACPPVHLRMGIPEPVCDHCGLGGTEASRREGIMVAAAA